MHLKFFRKVACMIGQENILCTPHTGENKNSNQYMIRGSRKAEY